MVAGPYYFFRAFFLFLFLFLSLFFFFCGSWYYFREVSWYRLWI